MKTLSDEQQKAAIKELLDKLAEYPEGIPTFVLIGIDRFRGRMVLTEEQAEQLLRQSGQILQRLMQVGMRVHSWWKLKTVPPEAPTQPVEPYPKWGEDAERRAQQYRQKGKWIGDWVDPQ